MAPLRELRTIYYLHTKFNQNLFRALTVKTLHTDRVTIAFLICVGIVTKLVTNFVQVKRKL